MKTENEKAESGIELSKVESLLNEYGRNYRYYSQAEREQAEKEIIALATRAPSPAETQETEKGIGCLECSWLGDKVYKYCELCSDKIRRMSHREFEEQYLGKDTRAETQVSAPIKLDSSKVVGEVFSLRTTGECESWSLADSVKMLIYAAEILLHKRDYDGGRHEEILYAKQAAEKYLIEAGFDISI
jgi:hypothetical protein